MANDNIKEVGLKFTADGSVDFQKTIKAIKNEMNLASAEFQKATSAMDKNKNSIEALTEKQTLYQKQIELQKQKINVLNSELEKLCENEEENADAIAKKKTELTKAETQLNKYEKSLKDVNGQLSTAYQENQRLEAELKKLGSELEQVKADYDKEISALKTNATETEKLTAKKKLLENETKIQAEKVEDLKKQLEIETNAEEKNEEAIAKKKLELTKAETELNNYQNELQETTKELSKHSETTDKVITNLSKVGTKCTDIGKKLSIVSAGIIGVTAAGVKQNAQLEQYKTALTTLTGSEEKAAQIMKQIQEDAKKTPFDVAGLTEANQLLISTGLDGSEARETILALGDAVSATGGGNDELSRMSANLQQIKNVGKASALDIKQFAYAGIDIYGLLADYLGITKEEAAEMTVTWDDLNGALINASKEGGKYFGAMQKQSETTSGSWSNLKESINSVIASFTESLLPTLNKIMKKFSEWLDKINGLDDGTKKIIITIALIVAAIGPLLILIGSMANGISSIITLTRTIIPLITGISTPILAVIAVIASLVAIITYLWNTNEEFRNNVMSCWQSIQDFFSAFLDWLGNVFGTGFDEKFGLFKAILDNFNQFISDLANSIMLIFQGIIDFLTGVFTGNWELAWNGIKEIFSGFQGAVDSIASFIQNIFNNLLIWLGGVFSTDWSNYFGIFGNVLNGFSTTVSGIIDSVRQIFSGLIDFIVGVFTGNWERAWNGVVSMFGGIMNGLGSVVKAPLNAVIGLINACIDGLNRISVSIPDWVPNYGGKSFGINIPKIPYLRRGIANVPYDDYLAYLHQGERVLTKEENKAYQRKEAQESKNVTYQIILNIDKVENNSERDAETLAKDIQFYLKKLEEAKGY